MLDVALKFLTKELNSYLLVRTGSDFGGVELCQLVDFEGKWAVPKDKIGAAVIHLDEERIGKPSLPEATWIVGGQVVRKPPVRLNLHVLFAARFQQHDEALRYLSHVVTYFQSHRAFAPSHYPGLDPRIENMTAELQSLTYEQ